MDVRQFMPVSETIKAKSKKRMKMETQMTNACNGSSEDDFAATLSILVNEATRGSAKTKKPRKSKTKKEQLKEEKNTRAAKDIYEKYKRSVAGGSDSDVTTEWIKMHLFDNCRMKSNQLYRILRYYQVIKHDSVAVGELRFSNIISTPFNFLNANHQLLSFKKCEFIMDVYKLKPKTDKAMIANGYIYDKFLGENTYYLSQFKFVHCNQQKKIREIKSLISTTSSTFPYKYDILENDFYETLERHGISKSSKSIQFGKNSQLALKTVENRKRTPFWTTERFLELEKTYGSLLRDKFGNEEKTECPYKKNAIKEWIKQTEVKINALKTEHERDINLNTEQIKAVNTALRYKLMCISGYPGTGKSTIVDFIVRFRREVMNEATCLMAPTGKAVKSLLTKLGGQSKKGCSPLIATCHKFVYNIFDEYKKALNDPNYDTKGSLFKSYLETEKNPFDCVIIDEASMIDFNIFMEIMDFVVEYGGSIIFVGDINQLPPVSVGRPYECIYKSGQFKCVELKDIMRSSGNISKFVLGLNANRFSELEHYIDGNEITFHEATNFSETYFKEYFRKIINSEENGLTGFKRNYSIITAQNGEEDGQGRDWDGSVNQLNQVLQGLCVEMKKKEMEHSADGEYEELLFVRTNKRCYYDSDRVIRRVNDYSTGKIRVNGEMGTVQMRKRIESSGKEKIVISVLYDDGDIEEDLDVLDLEDNFNLAYASTVHKMQGSENKNIIVIMSNEHYMWKGEGCKKLLYTAVSRAKEKLTILSFMGAFDESLTNCGKPEKSFHSEFLIKM